MNIEYHSYLYKDSELMAVPAVHHQTAFAAQVHNICCNKTFRPDAIAVELGHSVVLELVSFLKDLKQGGRKKVNLPCMMGLLVRNNFIHPDYLEKASLLQEFHKKPLYLLPDDILADRLNFNKWSSLLISPADSIIEAVRCAIELKIPVYGVDLTDFSRKPSGKFSLEDPQSAKKSTMEYANRTMKYCNPCRDQQIDLNREIYMSAGLKHCLQKHKKVLFTCGLAHWESIISQLNNKEILPFPVHEIKQNIEIKRVIIHPGLAVSVMEVIPQITFNFETNRQPVNLKQRKYSGEDTPTIVRTCLDETYKNYTTETIHTYIKESDSSTWANIGQYEQYLFHLSAIKQRKVPDFSTMMSAAEAMMDDKFCGLLMEQMMKVKPDWVSSKDYPELPVIVPPANNKQRKIIRKRKYIGSENLGNNDETEDEEISIHISEATDKIFPTVIKYSNRKTENNKKDPRNQNISYWLWPPCESLIFGMAFKAAEIANMNQNRCRQSKVFEGSLEGGLDTKATIRSMIRNEKKFYVSKLSTGAEQSIVDGTNPDPIVFFFPTETDTLSASWNAFTAGNDIGLFVKDPELFQRIVDEKGDVFVSSIILEEYIEAPSHLKSLFSYMSKANGTVMFGNPCINARQSAIWLETGRYKCCPILRYNGINEILKYYQLNFNIDIYLKNWKEALIRMAIPFAKKSVTIIADNGFVLSELVRIEAAQKQVTLNIVTHDNFPAKQLEEARHRFSVPSMDKAGLNFVPEAEILLGQTKETYFEMLPYAIRKQVGYSEK